MRILLDRERLLSFLYYQQGLLLKRAEVLGASSLLLSVKKGELELLGCSSDIVLKQQFAVKSDAECSMRLPAHTLYEIVRSLSEEKVELLVDDDGKEGEVKLICQNSVFNLLYKDKENLYDLVDDWDDYCEVPAKDLLNMINKTGFAMSLDEKRFNINGIYVQIYSNRMKFVATDMYRLAVTQLSMQSAKENEVIIPRRAINELKKLLSNRNSAVKISFCPHSIKFALDDTQMHARLIEGEYPDYENVIPSNSLADIVLNINVDTFITAVKRVAIMTQKRNFILVSFNKDGLLLECQECDIGNAREFIPIKHKNAGIKIAFNSAYMLDMLEQCETKTIDLHITENRNKIYFYQGDDLYLMVTIAQVQNA